MRYVWRLCGWRGLDSDQNAAARRRSDDVMTSHARAAPVVLWLPVRRRVDYKIACLVHHSLSDVSPAYLADDINLVVDSGRRLLLSAVDRTCVVPRTHNTFGDRSFDASPRV